MKEAMTADKKSIKGEVIILDYKDLRNTRFERYTMVFRGGRPPPLVNNDFIDCQWVFENEAQNTLVFAT